jgi:hypothetical protein
MDWKLFLKELLLDNDTKTALGLLLGAAIMFIPGMTIEIRTAMVVLVFGVLKILAGIQSAKSTHDGELEYRAYLAEKENK